MTTRRNFLRGILALGAAPAIVRASSLMPIWVPPAPSLLTLADTLARHGIDAPDALQGSLGVPIV